MLQAHVPSARMTRLTAHCSPVEIAEFQVIDVQWPEIERERLEVALDQRGMDLGSPVSWSRVHEEPVEPRPTGVLSRPSLRTTGPAIAAAKRNAPELYTSQTFTWPAALPVRSGQK